VLRTTGILPPKERDSSYSLMISFNAANRLSTLSAIMLWQRLFGGKMPPLRTSPPPDFWPESQPET